MSILLLPWHSFRLHFFFVDFPFHKFYFLLLLLILYIYNFALLYLDLMFVFVYMYHAISNVISENSKSNLFSFADNLLMCFQHLWEFFRHFNFFSLLICSFVCSLFSSSFHFYFLQMILEFFIKNVIYFSSLHLS